ncbi:hypothetical protein D9C73_027125 [Collichthys lucidus]|uniref:Uncharacterized protein n=1 Tax=Collichthys lucidus TaxID=240159 RepID=A0A4U5VVQ9_COLLU|nr:hypothetical protein D9C73_027125 [Collichthys lucidus]
MSEPPPPPTACSKILLCVLPIAEIAIGAIYLDDCPRQSYIPIYLIVMGVFSLVLVLLSCLLSTLKPEDRSTTWNSLITCFLFCWFIAGNVWIYSIYKPNFDKNTTNVDPYCDKTLYLFAFWVTTLGYICAGLLFVISCCC